MRDASADRSPGEGASPAAGLKALGPFVSRNIDVKALGSVHDVANMRWVRRHGEQALMPSFSEILKCQDLWKILQPLNRQDP